MSDILVKYLENYQIVLYTAGAGAQAMSHFTLHPGSSKFALESISLYAKGSLELLLERKIEKFVSEEVAEDMALKALIKSHKILKKDQGFKKEIKVVGIGITGALSSVNPRTGRHHAFICLHFGDRKYIYHINLTKGVRTREEEDNYVSLLVFKLILMHCKKQQISMESQQYQECAIILKDCELTTISQKEDMLLLDLLVTKQKYIHSILFDEGHYELNPQITQGVVLSGSFNPIHDGHIEIMQKAASMFSFEHIFLELSIMNADKGTINQQEVVKRIDLIKKRKLKIIISNIPLFKDKTIFLKDGVFALGMDTFLRLIDVKYYNNSSVERDIALLQMISNNNKIVVAPRYNEKEQKIEHISDFEIPPLIAQYITEIEGYQNDLSSTKIRQIDEIAH